METSPIFDKLFTFYVSTFFASFAVNYVYNHNIYWKMIHDQIIIGISMSYAFIFTLLCIGFYNIKKHNKHMIYRELDNDSDDNNTNNVCDCSSCMQSDESDTENDSSDGSSNSSIKKTETLSKRMKSFEVETQNKNVIEGYETFVIRLDGRGFSKFTGKYFQKPFDENFATIMRNTAYSLFKEFHPTLIHVQSDEFTLVFQNICTQEEFENEPNKYKHSFGGKVGKLLSVISSYASGSFNQNLNKFLKSTTDEKYNDLKDNDFTVCFNSRIYVIPQDYEVVNYLYWRSVIDGYTNTVLMYARNMFDIAELKNLSPHKMIEKMRTKDFEFNKQSNHIKYGWILKNSQIMSLGEDKENENSEDAYRYIPQACSFRLKYSPSIKELLLDPVWNDEFIDSLDCEIETF
jgi:tRNA(His) 5'-end guanylyltransferase